MVCGRKTKSYSKIREVKRKYEKYQEKLSGERNMGKRQEDLADNAKSSLKYGKYQENLPSGRKR